ncbi:hypothetical protein [Fodinicola feengrottensis]|uniref:hypothetical protein n=1 Tax=Fodinicola feengrottensis TaxID=435914 RepID=UPI0013D7C1DC|nr:hypothetical protein [Fodinicola feengrottensis]
MTVGLRAADESDSYGWKKFTASNTAIVIEYNTVPAAPTSMSVSENKPCVIGADRPTIGTATPTVYATMRDADAGQNLRARFQWWTTNSVLKGEYLTSLQNPVNTVFQAQVPAGMYADGGDISWRVRAEDGTDVGPFSTWCEYHVDATHPEHSPTVASTQFPTGGQLGNGVGRTGTFTFGPNGEVGVVRYAYAVNSTTMDVNRSVPATGLGMFGALGVYADDASGQLPDGVDIGRCEQPESAHAVFLCGGRADTCVGAVAAQRRLRIHRGGQQRGRWASVVVAGVGDELGGWPGGRRCRFRWWCGDDRRFGGGFGETGDGFGVGVAVECLGVLCGGGSWWFAYDGVVVAVRGRFAFVGSAFDQRGH